MPDADGFDHIVQAVQYSTLILRQGRIGQAGSNISLVALQSFAQDFVQLQCQVGTALKSGLAVIIGRPIVDDAAAQGRSAAKEFLWADPQRGFLCNPADADVLLVDIGKLFKVLDIIQRNCHVGQRVITEFTVHGTPCPGTDFLIQTNGTGRKRCGWENHIITSFVVIIA